jgi:hypothetical protein
MADLDFFHTVQWRRAGIGRRWFATEASAASTAAELVDVPLAQTGEGIAECELLRWFVTEVSAARLHLLRLAFYYLTLRS